MKNNKPVDISRWKAKQLNEGGDETIRSVITII